MYSLIKLMQLFISKPKYFYLLVEIKMIEAIFGFEAEM